MPTIEKKFLQWVEDNLIIIIAVLGTVISLLIRYAFRDVVSGDFIVYLEGWYNQILGGGIRGLSQQVGNYNFLYQLCVLMMTYFPVKPLHAYKIVSIVFDYLLAIIVMKITWAVTEQNKKLNAVLAYFAVVFSPIVILNSSAWAQCDAIYVFWVMAAMYALLKKKYQTAFFLLGLAFSFKLQTVFILPFFLLFYFINRKFSIFNFLLLPTMLIATALPAVILGRNIMDTFLIYWGQAAQYKQVALNYPSFWTLFFEAQSTEYYNVQNPAAILLTIVVLASFMVSWVINKIELSNKNIIYTAFILSYTCVLFLPQMHERYGYMYEILAIIILFLNKESVKLIVPLYMLTITTYGKFLFKLPHSVDVYTGIANISVWIGYVYILSKELYGTDKKQMREVDRCADGK